MKYFIAAAVLTAVNPSAFAQPVTTPVAVAEPQPSVLRAGTPVNLRTLTELTTKGKHLKVGDRFGLEVADPVMLNGQVVIPVGSYAVGEITSVRNKGMWGKSGNIETRLLFVTANNRQMRLSGGVADKEVKAGGGAIATSAIVFLPAGFFMTGTSAVVASGTRVVALLDEDVSIAFVAPVPVMNVAAAPPVAVSVPEANIPTATAQKATLSTVK